MKKLLVSRLFGLQNCRETTVDNDLVGVQFPIYNFKCAKSTSSKEDICKDICTHRYMPWHYLWKQKTEDTLISYTWGTIKLRFTDAKEHNCYKDVGRYLLTWKTVYGVVVGKKPSKKRMAFLLWLPKVFSMSVQEGNKKFIPHWKSFGEQEHCTYGYSTMTISYFKFINSIQKHSLLSTSLLSIISTPRDALNITSIVI